jgi:hypothetical protein
MQEICRLRTMWRVLETGLRKLLTGHEEGNDGYGQGVSYRLPRQRPTLPPRCRTLTYRVLPYIPLSPR